MINQQQVIPPVAAIVPPEVARQVERKRSIHEEMGSRGLLVKQGSGCQNECQRADYAAGPVPQGYPAQGLQSGLPPQNYQVAGALPQGLPYVGISPVPTDPFIQKSQGIRPGEGLLYDARGLPIDSQGYLPNTGPTIGQRMRDAAHIGEPNGQSNYVDVHSMSTGSLQNFDNRGPMVQQGPAPIRQGEFVQREMVREQALPPQVYQQGPMPPQEFQQAPLPPQQFVGQQQGFVQQQAFVPNVVPVKGVGIVDKAYMGIHNLKEHIKDKIYAHQETKELKKMTEAQMKAERQFLEARQYPIEAQLAAERKAFLEQQEMAVGGLKSDLAAERAAFEQRQAALQAQLDAERRAFLQQQEAAVGGLRSEFAAERQVLEQNQAGVAQQLEAERIALLQQQDAAAHGLKADLAAQRKMIEAAGVQKRAVENQIFADQVIAEHTVDALNKAQKHELKAERKALEAGLKQEVRMERAQFEQQAALEKQNIQQQVLLEGQALEQQRAALVQQPQQFVQQQQQFIQQPQQFVQQLPTVIEQETHVIRSQALAGGAGLQQAVGGLGGQVMSQGAGYYNQGGQMLNQGGQMLNQGGQFIDQAGNTIERRIDNDVKNIRGGQEYIQREKDIVRDPTGRVIADAKAVEKDAVKHGRNSTEVKHEEHTKVNERI